MRGHTHVTVVYKIADEKEFSKDNPLHYRHHGLEAVATGLGNGFEEAEKMEAALERFRAIEEPLVAARRLVAMIADFHYTDDPQDAIDTVNSLIPKARDIMNAIHNAEEHENATR